MAHPILKIPYMLIVLFFVYWSSAISALMYRIRFLDSAKRKDQYDWASVLIDFFGIKIVVKGDNKLHKSTKEQGCMYLCNHRSWADFFIDVYITEGTAAPMSRLMVAVAVPVFIACSAALKAIVLFKRQAIKDKETFNTWLDAKLAESPLTGFLVFPEGHRAYKSPTSLPLKRGMLAYAYSRKQPVQIIITKGKELVLNEKHLESKRGVTLVTGFSDVIKTQDFPDYQAFVAEVQRVWDATWADVYGANAAELKPLQQQDVPRYDYPKDMRIKSAAVTIVSLLAFFAVLAGVAWTGSALLSLFGPLKQVVVALVSIWTGISLGLWIS